MQQDMEKVGALQQDKKGLEDKIGSQVRQIEELKYQVGKL